MSQEVYFSILIFIGHIMAQLPNITTFQYIYCNETITGELSSPSDINAYYFYLSMNASYVSFDSCGSDFDTFLYLFDVENEQWFTADNEGDCGHSAQLLIPQLPPNMYILAISGTGVWDYHYYGNFQLSISCPMFNDRPYEIINLTSLTLDAAELECERRYGSTLATITTEKNIKEVRQIYNKTGYDINTLSAWIGSYKDVKNGSKWQWIDGTFWTGFNWSSPDGIFKQSDQNRIGTVMSFADGMPEFHEQYSITLQSALCNGPQQYQIIQNIYSITTTYNLWESDCYVTTDCWFIEAPPFFYLNEVTIENPSEYFIAFWNYTLFILGMNQIYYQGVFQALYGFDPYRFNWKSIQYHSNISNRIIEPKGIIQNGSSLYVYLINNDSQEIRDTLMYINLESLEVISHEIPLKLSANAIVCLVSDLNNVYIIMKSFMWIYDIHTDKWTKTRILNDDPAACVMHENERFVYIFGIQQPILYKYDIEYSSTIMLQEPNLCSTGIGHALRAPNDKAYLHGCYIGGWKTLIFDMDTERFERMTVNIPPKSYNMPYYHTGKIFTWNDNQILMGHKTDQIGEIQIVGLNTNLVVVNFQETSNEPIWPSDGITIKYYITIPMVYNVNTTFNIWFQCVSNITNTVNESLVISTYDNCDCQQGGCFNCYQKFPFDKYLTLMENHIDRLTFYTLPTEFLFFNNHLITPLIVNKYIVVTLQRCNISFIVMNTRSSSDNPFVNLSYILNEPCYSRNGKNFLFSITITSSAMNTQKHAIISISNHSDSYICKLCEVNVTDLNSCEYCSHHTIEIEHEIMDKHQTLDISFASNTIDLNVYPLQPLNVEYFYDKPGSQPTYIMWIAIGTPILVIVICILAIYYYCKTKRLKQKQEQHTHYIKNPLVLSVGIEFYNQKVKNKGADIYCKNLDGIDADYTNLKKLCKLLNYDIYPKDLKLEWTQDETIKFIQENAQRAASNIDTKNDRRNDPNKKVNGYDGIVAVFSGHGYHNNIITSDYQLINKTAIHRQISTAHPELREIPRIFVFDCCDGDQERSHYDEEDEIQEDENNDIENFDERNGGKGIKKKRKNKTTATIVDTNTGKGIKKKRKNKTTASAVSDTGKGIKKKRKNKTTASAVSDTGKDFSVKDIETTNPIWKHDEKNPDYMLSLIHAANEGFQAKMNPVDGSYLIYEMIKGMMMNIEKSKDLFFGDIVDAVQAHLHEKGKQQITPTFNNYTRYIKFIKNVDTVNVNTGNGRTDNLNISIESEEKNTNDIDEVDDMDEEKQDAFEIEMVTASIKNNVNDVANTQKTETESVKDVHSYPV